MLGLWPCSSLTIVHSRVAELFGVKGSLLWFLYFSYSSQGIDFFSGSSG